MATNDKDSKHETAASGGSQAGGIMRQWRDSEIHSQRPTNDKDSKHETAASGGSQAGGIMRQWRDSEIHSQS